MSFRLLSKLVTLNDLERRNGPYFALFHRRFVYDVVAKQLHLPWFQNLLLIVYNSFRVLAALLHGSQLVGVGNGAR